MQKAATVYPGHEHKLNSLPETGWRVVPYTPFHPAFAAGGKCANCGTEEGTVLVLVERLDSVADSSAA